MKNFSDDLSKIRREMAKDFRTFRQIYFSHYNKLPEAKFHRDLTSFLSGMHTSRGTKFGLAAPRGSGKTTIATTQYVLFCICNALEPYIVLVSNTIAQATGLLTDIKLELQENEELIRDYPDICEIGRKPGPPRWREDEIITRNKVKLTTLSYGQQARGRKNKSERPSLIIGDDIEPGENTQTPESSAKLYNWYNKSILKLGSPGTNFLLLGTIHNYNSLLAKFLNAEAHSGWKGGAVKAVQEWSVRPELWATWAKIYHFLEAYNGQEGPKAALEYFKANEAALLEGTKVYWPEQLSYYDLMVIREENYRSFESEYQNDPVNPEDCDFDLENEATFWEDKHGSKDELLRFIGRHAEFYGACDPSLGKDNRRGDFSAIVNIVRDGRTGILYALDADIKRRSTDQTVEDILGYAKVRPYVRFGFEANQFQCLMESELRRRGNVMRTYLPIESLMNTRNKRARILGLQPFIKSGTLQLSRRHQVLLDQLRVFPYGSHDDGVDALEMAVRVCASPEYIEPKIHVIRFDSGFGGISRRDNVGF